jgi:hypothetical protein
LADADAAGPLAADRLREHLDHALGPFDVMLVNGAPLPVADAQVLLALAPTSAAVTQAYTELKTLARGGRARRCELVVHGARTEGAALDAFDSVAITAGRFLGMTLAVAGTMPGTPRAPRIAAKLASCADHFFAGVLRDWARVDPAGDPCDAPGDDLRRIVASRLAEDAAHRHFSHAAERRAAAWVAA